MKKSFKLGVIGAGFMSLAIINGLVSSKFLNSNEIIVSDKNSESLDKIAKLGVKTSLSNLELVNNAEFTLFAVKPQSLDAVLEEIKGANCNKFISIMAGIKKDRIRKTFSSSSIARCMPNTPCSISSGAVGLDLTDFTCEQDKAFIKGIFGVISQVVLVDENLLNAVTGVSGSSPAYFYLFLKGIIDAGVKQGLTEEQAKLLATNTMIGAGKMVLMNSDKSLDELINAVCSKGGTTIEAIKVYQDGGLTNLTTKAVCACVKRAEELENI